MRINLFLASAGIALTALAIAGCGGDNNETSTTSAAAPSAGGQTVNIGESEYKLDPSDPTVKAGTVSFDVTNNGTIDHKLEVEGPEGEQELEQDLAPGESGTLTVDLSKPGKYEFYCPIDSHRQRGMEGEITVGGSGSSGSEDEVGTTTTTTTGGGGGYGY
jgi:uncharacterized cupredoxin-like copper-binding protein